MVLPSGEKATEYTGPLCALCFSPLSSRDAAASVGALRFWARWGIGRARVPASHTLSVPDAPPETIVLPSGSNCTDMMP